MKHFLLLLFPWMAMAAPTQIRDTIYTSFPGVLFSGRVTVSAPSMTDADGRTIQRWEQSYQIVNGVIAVDLEPNDTATPSGTSYYVVYRPTQGMAWSERWIVPTSATPLKIGQVRASTVPTPAAMFQPSQILAGGATVGQALTWNATSSRWQPGTITGGVTSVFGRAGAVSAQAGDYSFSQLSGTVAHSQIAQNSAATGQYLQWGGSAWAPATPAYSDLSGVPSTFTPAAHAPMHAVGGPDPVTLAESQVTNLTTDLAGKVATTRQVATDGMTLTGGGDLSADRTLSVRSGGIGSTQIDVSFLQKRVVTISAAQMLALKDTPVEIVPTPGTGKILIPIYFFWEYVYGTTPYSGGTSCFFDVRYGTAGQTFAINLTRTFVVGQTTNYYRLQPVFQMNAGASASENMSLTFWLSGMPCGSNISGGDGTMKITTWYAVITF